MCSERPTPGFTRKDLVLSTFSRVSSTCQLYCLAIFQFVFCWREWTQDNEHDYHRNLGKNGKLPCPFCPTVVCFVRCSLEDQGPTVPPGTPGLGSSRLTQLSHLETCVRVRPLQQRF